MAPRQEPADDSPAPAHEPRRRADARPAIGEATEQLHRINRDLQSLLVEMEKALEILEEAEVQKYGDEREIDSLRAAIRQLNRTRDNIPRQQPSRSGQDNRQRHPQRDHRFQSSHRQRERPRGPERNPEGTHAPEHQPSEPPREETRAEDPHEPEIPI